MHEWDNWAHSPLISFALGKITSYLVKKSYLLKFLCIEVRRLIELNVKLIGSGINIEKKLTSAEFNAYELFLFSFLR